jgi:hypothetical protein
MKIPPRSARPPSSRGRGGVTETEVTAWEQDLAGLGDDYFFSLNRHLFIAQRS